MMRQSDKIQHHEQPGNEGDSRSQSRGRHRRVRSHTIEEMQKLINVKKESATTANPKIPSNNHKKGALSIDPPDLAST